jgi:hypothetical protein
MSVNDIPGRPARELSDVELEQQGTQAHATRNWVFLHGSAEQFAHHTTRMLELEREYVRRHPRRTWQGSGGAPRDVLATAEAWRQSVRAVVQQLAALVELPDPPMASPVSGDPATVFLTQIAAAPDGRLHKLEAHQVAREVGLERAALARLYNTDSPMLVTEQEYRVITEAGRARVVGTST